MNFWLAWAPSCWKSSVVEELSKRWYWVFTEAATQIIELRMSSWESLELVLSDPDLFQKQIHDKKLLQLKEAWNKNNNFFDTTIVEDIAHRKVTWVEIESIQEVIDEIRYDKIFYMVHPWGVEDNWIRVENDNEIEELDKLKREAFENNWYKIIKVPTFVKDWEELTDEILIKAVEKRVNFILWEVNL
jgi:predicted ATPase